MMFLYWFIFLQFFRKSIAFYDVILINPSFSRNKGEFRMTKPFKKIVVHMVGLDSLRGLGYNWCLFCIILILNWDVLGGFFRSLTLLFLYFQVNFN